LTTGLRHPCLPTMLQAALPVVASYPTMYKQTKQPLYCSLLSAILQLPFTHNAFKSCPYCCSFPSYQQRTTSLFTPFGNPPVNTDRPEIQFTHEALLHKLGHTLLHWMISSLPTFLCIDSTNLALLGACPQLC